MSSPRHSAEEAHPDPPSPTPPPPPAAPPPADITGGSPASQSSVGQIGSTSGRSRFYDALRRIGFPHPPPPSPPVQTSVPTPVAVGDYGTSPAAQEAPGPIRPSDNGGEIINDSTAMAAASIQQNTGVTRGMSDDLSASLESSASMDADESGPAASDPTPSGPQSAGASDDSAPPAPPGAASPAGTPFFGLDIMLDANGGPPPTRDEMETLMRSLFGPNVVIPPQPVGSTLVGGQTAIPTIQAIPPPGMFANLDSAPTAPDNAAQPTGQADNGNESASVAPVASGLTAGGDGEAEGDIGAAESGPTEPAGQRLPVPGPLGQLINQFIGQLVAQHRSATANTGAPPVTSMPILISFTFGSPGQMVAAAGLNDDKVPDPERAAELLSALSRPSVELIERLDHALRCEEADAGVEIMEQTGANCSVCMDTLLPLQANAVEPEDPIVSLPCGHAFHESCLRPWLETNTNCPTCRFDLDPLSTTLRPNRQTTGRATAASSQSPVEAGAIPAASGANAQGRGHPYSRPTTRPGTPTTAIPPRSASAPPQPQPRRYVLPPGRQTLLERVIHLERAHHIRCSLALCSHADPDLPSPERRTVALVAGIQPGLNGFQWLACEHRFHPDCLRVACRVRGDREIVDAEGRRLVSCDVKGCDGEGWIEAADWEDDTDKMDPNTSLQSDTARAPAGFAMEVDTA